MKIEIEISGILQFRTVLHTSGVSAQHSDGFLIHHVLENEERSMRWPRLIPIVGAQMINQADQMRGSFFVIDRVVSFILSSLIVALPFLTLLLMKYPLGSLRGL